MSSLNLVFVYSRDVASDDDVSSFVKALGRQLNMKIESRREHLVDAVSVLADFYILAGFDCEVELLRCPEPVRADIAARLVPINASRPKIFQKLLERYCVAAAIDSMSIAEWGADPRPGVAGIFGRKDVAEDICATQEFLSSERYAYLKCPLTADLPAFLVAYLMASRRHLHGARCASK